MPDLLTRLKDLISNGLVIDIFRAEQSLALFEEVGKRATLLNEHGYGHLFGSLQGYLVESLIVAVCKMYELPDSRYPIRSIPTVIQFLKDDAASVPVLQPELLKLKMVKHGFDEYRLVGKTSAALTATLAVWLGQTLPSVDPRDPGAFSEPIEALRQLRNKRIAHNESVDPHALDRTTWGHLKTFVDFAKTTVIIVGTGYLGINYELTNGEYIHTNDARKAGRALARLLRQANLTTDGGTP